VQVEFAKGIHALKGEANRLQEDDPLIARQVDGRACKHCIRVFGKGRDIIPYRLSVVEANSLAGANFGVPAAEWVAVVGPLHPNCRCPPYFRYSEGLMDDVEELADLIDALA